MIRISHVVCPVDFSDASRRALEQAITVAKWYEARLSAVHVFTPPPSLDLPNSIEEATERARATGELHRFVASIEGVNGVQLRVLAGPGIAKTIVNDAVETRADLLVLASHGRTGIQRLLLGSVAEDVIRHVPCPAFVVPARIADEVVGSAEFRRVLCAVDFSDASLLAVEYAMTLAEEADASLTLLHVCAPPSDAGGTDQCADRAKQRLDGLIPERVRANCTVDTRVRTGVVPLQILDEASALHADMIVMGIHGRSALDLMVFGSDAARVIRAAECPVLVVRRPTGGRAL